MPESKRYATDENERSIVMKRYAEFGTTLLGVDAPCLMFHARLNPGQIELADSNSWTYFRRIAESEEDIWHTWQAVSVWNAGVHSHMLRDIADDRIRNVIFLSQATDCIFAPYDGGADGFSPDVSRVRQLKREFRKWRSPRVDGL